MQRKVLIGSCLIISLAGHLFFYSAFGRLGALDIGKPVSAIKNVEVDLKSEFPSEKPTETSKASIASKTETQLPAAIEQQPSHSVITPNTGKTTKQDKLPDSAPSVPEQIVNVPLTKATNQFATNNIKSVPVINKKQLVSDPPLRATGEFMGSEYEKLVYRISLLGLPVGSAELEANNVKGEVWITLRIKSDLALSALYPVDNLIETRHINGNFIITRIRQQEGSFRGDRGFTLFLRDKNVFWIDRLTNRSVKEQLPNSDVLDILSGLYLMRNRLLKVGTVEKLHIYDSDTYSEVPVEVLRQEKVTLPAFREIDALVVQPQLKSDGVFKHSGDIQIWLSDDQFKVPVKIVTSISLGQVTAELVSAETKSADPKNANNSQIQISDSELISGKK